MNQSKADLLAFLQVSDLSGKYFLDVGCGSGLSSLAAFRSGASKIVSFDYDQNSVITCNKLKQHFGNPSYWEVRQGDILDDDFVESLQPADIVYAWGVLHHTGDVWHALANTLKLMKADGLIFIALYEYDVQVDPTPEFWLDIKKKYNSGGWFTRRKMELWYIWRFDFNRDIRSLPKFIRHVRSRGRGMAFYTDLVDWLGGWPMEFVKLEDVRKWAEKNNLEIVNLNYGHAANTEYLLKKNRT